MKLEGGKRIRSGEVGVIRMEERGVRSKDRKEVSMEGGKWKRSRSYVGGKKMRRVEDFENTGKRMRGKKGGGKRSREGRLEEREEEI